MFDFDPNDTDRVGHVGMYLSDTEMVHAGSCKGGVSAVCRTTINWTNVVAVKRPAA
jgi:cell wall-associated NlpC family hydrolase